MRFLIGLAAGYFLGLLLAPASGEETRAQLIDKARELSELPQQKAAELAQASKQQVGEIGAQVGRQAAEAAVQAATDELRGGNRQSA